MFAGSPFWSSTEVEVPDDIVQELKVARSAED
jgi:hypothetical protein